MVEGGLGGAVLAEDANGIVRSNRLILEAAGSVGTLANAQSFTGGVSLGLPSGSYQNYVFPEDVNVDGVVAPIDALMVINELNAGAFRTSASPTSGLQAVVGKPKLMDVNGDAVVSPIDALYVINHLNSNTRTGSGLSAEQRLKTLETAVKSGKLPEFISQDDARELIETLALGGRPEHGVFTEQGKLRSFGGDSKQASQSAMNYYFSGTGAAAQFSAITSPDRLNVDLVRTPGMATALEVDAGGSIYLNLTGRLRDTDANQNTFDITNLTSTADVDVLLQPALQETDALGGTLAGVAFTVSQTQASGSDFISGTYYTFFTPDGEVADRALLDPRVFVDTTTGNDLNALYDFAEIAGNNLKVFAADPAASQTQVDIEADTDVAFDGQIDVLTNGNIVLTEIVGDLRINDITSNAGDVFLTTTDVDADIYALSGLDSSTAYVSGNSIHLDATGFIGATGDHLEINSNLVAANPLSGLVYAEANQGIYLVETVGDLNVDGVASRYGDVALETLGGSILDGKVESGGDLADVQGRDIDLIAKFGGIGDSSNDLEVFGAGIEQDVDSSLRILAMAPSSGRLVVDAEGSVFVKEIDAALNVASVVTTTGDIRLTVLDTSTINDPLDGVYSEDLVLSAAATSTLRGVAIVGNSVETANGNVTLIAGDDVYIPNGTRVEASFANGNAATITIAGDIDGLPVADGGMDNEKDPFTGSTMELEGTILAEQLIVQGGPESDFIQILGTGGINPSGMTTLRGLAGDDRFFVQSISGTTTIEGGAGEDRYYVNSQASKTAFSPSGSFDLLENNPGDPFEAMTGTLEWIRGELTIDTGVEAVGQTERDVLRVGTGGSTSAVSGYLEIDATTGFDTIHGLGLGSGGTISFYTPTEFTSSGGPEPTFDSAFLMVGLSDFDDTFQIKGVTDNHAAYVFGRNGDDTLNAGNDQNSLADISGIAAFYGDSGADDVLNIYGDASAGLDPVTGNDPDQLTGIGVTGLEMGRSARALLSVHNGTFGAGYDETLNDYPAAIYYAERTTVLNSSDSFSTSVESVNLLLGASDDSLLIDSVNDYTTTNVRAGDGDDTLTVGSSRTGLNPDSTRRVDFVFGSLNLHGDGGSNTIIVDDSGEDDANTGTYDGNSVLGLDMPATGSINLNSAVTVQVKLGAQNDTFYVPTTNNAVVTTLQTGGGFDTVYVGTTKGNEAAGDLSRIHGDFVIEGQGPRAQDLVYFNDQSSTGNHTFRVSNFEYSTRLALSASDIEVRGRSGSPDSENVRIAFTLESGVPADKPRASIDSGRKIMTIRVNDKNPTNVQDILGAIRTLSGWWAESRSPSAQFDPSVDFSVTGTTKQDTETLIDGRLWPVDTTLVTRDGMATVSYRSAETVVLNAGQGQDEIRIDATHREQSPDGGKNSTFTVNGGLGDDSVLLGSLQKNGKYNLDLFAISLNSPPLNTEVRGIPVIVNGQDGDDQVHFLDTATTQDGTLLGFAERSFDEIFPAPPEVKPVGVLSLDGGDIVVTAATIDQKFNQVEISFVLDASVASGSEYADFDANAKKLEIHVNDTALIDHADIVAAISSLADFTAEASFPTAAFDPAVEGGETATTTDSPQSFEDLYLGIFGEDPSSPSFSTIILDRGENVEPEPLNIYARRTELVEVSLGGGDDVVQLFGGTYSSDFKVNGGGGDDTFNIGNDVDDQSGSVTPVDLQGGTVSFYGQAGNDIVYNDFEAGVPGTALNVFFDGGSNSTTLDANGDLVTGDQFRIAGDGLTTGGKYFPNASHSAFTSGSSRYGTLSVGGNSFAVTGVEPLIVHGLPDFEVVAPIDQAADLNLKSKAVADLNLTNLVLQVVTVDGVVTWRQQDELEYEDAAEPKFVGKVLSADGNRVAVGADLEGATYGTVYIYDLVGGKWQESAKLYPSDLIPGTANPLGEMFGAAVSLKGDNVFIGAPGDDGNANNQGAVYWFQRDSLGAWQPKQKIVPLTSSGSLAFGRSVSFDGGTLVVGSPGMGGNDDYDRAFLFGLTNGLWSEKQSLSGTSGSDFGRSVAISGSYLTIGMPNSSEDRIFAGAVAIYKQDNKGMWSGPEYLFASDPESYENFGHSVAIQTYAAGTAKAVVQVVAGAPLWNGIQNSATDQGRAFIFENEGNGWQRTARLTANGGLPETDASLGDLSLNKFGSSVSIRGNYVAVGAPEFDSGKGAAYVFYYLEDEGSGNGSSWIRSTGGQGSGQLQTATPESGENFGQAVALDGANLIVGIPGYNDRDANDVILRGGDTGAFATFSTDAVVPSETLAVLRAEKIESPLASDSFSENSLYDPVTRTLFVSDVDKSTVHTYVNEGIYWRPAQTINPIGTIEFGYSMDLDDGRLVIGDPGANRVYYYQFDSVEEKWENQGSHINGNSYGKGRFGSAVAIDGTKLVIGAEDASLRYYSEGQASPNYRLDLGQTGVVHAFTLDIASNVWNRSKVLMPERADLPYDTSIFFDPAGWNQVVIDKKSGGTRTLGIGVHSFDRDEFKIGDNMTLAPRLGVLISDIYGDNAWAYRTSGSGFEDEDTGKYIDNDDVARVVVGTLEEYTTARVLIDSTWYEYSTGSHELPNGNVKKIEVPSNTIGAIASNNGIGWFASRSSTGTNDFSTNGYESKNGDTLFVVLSKETIKDIDELEYADLQGSKWGASLDIVGNQVFVGAPGEDLVAAYDLTDASESHWTLQVRDGSSNDIQESPLRPFAYADKDGGNDRGIEIQALDSNSFYAGIPGNNTVGAYEASSNSLTVTTFSAPLADERFGDRNTISIQGDQMMIGAPDANSGAGVAYLYDVDANYLDLQLKPFRKNSTTNTMENDPSENRRFGVGGSPITEGLYVVGSDVQLTDTANKPIDLDATLYTFRRRGPRWTPGLSSGGNSPVLTQPKALPTAKIGTDVDVDGNTAIVGARDYDNRGAAIVYKTIDGSDRWTPEALLRPAAASLGDLFGSSVAIDGDTAVVGAPAAKAGVGAVYVFQRTNGNWTQQAELVGTGTGGFGSAVELSEDTILVGSSTENALFVFEIASGKWTASQQLNLTDPLQSLDADGATLAVGIPDSSQVGIYERVIDQQGFEYWSLADTLHQSDVANLSGDFGYDVAISGDVLLVASPQFGSGADKVLVYNQNSGSWAYDSNLPFPDQLKGGDEFGSSIGLDGDKAVVGAPKHDRNTSVTDANDGDAFTYEFRNGVWQVTDNLPGSDAELDDLSGSSVAISGDTVVVGAPQFGGRRDENIDTQGAGYAWIRQVSDPVNVLTLAEQTTLIAGAQSNVLRGQIDGTLVPDFHFFDIPDVTVQLGDQDDRFEISEDGLTAYGMSNFTLNTGSGDDEVITNSEKLVPPQVGKFLPFGDFTGTADGDAIPDDADYGYDEIEGAFLLNGEAGNDTLKIRGDFDWTLATDALKVADTQLADLSAFEIAELHGGDSENELSIESWNGTATVDGKGGSDQINIFLADVSQVQVDDSDGSDDQLDIFGSTVDETLVVELTQVKLDLNSVGYSGVEGLNLYTLGGEDQLNLVDTTALAVLLDGGSNADRYNVIDPDPGKSTSVTVHDSGPLPELGGGDDTLGLPTGATHTVDVPFSVGQKTVVYDNTIELFGVANVAPVLHLDLTMDANRVVMDGNDLWIDDVFYDITVVTELTMDALEGDDEFIILSVKPDLAVLEFNGNIGADSVHVDAGTANTWNLTGRNQGNVAGEIEFDFEGMETLIGGNADDAFVFGDDTAEVDGNIVGGNGKNTLDYSNLMSGATVNLQNGSGNQIGGTFFEINDLIGTSTSDTLIGPDRTSDWIISGTNSGQIMNVVSFLGFENLTGGARSDDFDLQESGNITGVIDGGLGTNTLLLSMGSQADDVQLMAGVVERNGIATIYASISKVVVSGQAGNDLVTVTLAASGLPSVIEVIGDNASHDSLIVNGTSGSDTITVVDDQLSAFTTTISMVEVVNLSVFTGDGEDSVEISGVGVSGVTTVDVEEGNDEVYISYPLSTGSLFIEGGGGTDDRLLVATADLNDTIELDSNSIQVESDNLLHTTTGFVGFELLEIDTEGGADKVVISDTHLGSTEIRTQSGSDEVTIAGSSGFLTVDTGAGRDQVNVQAIASTTEVILGRNNDSIYVSSDAPANMGTLAGIQGLLKVDGGGNSDQMFVSDAGNTSESAGVLSPSMLTGLGMPYGIDFVLFENLELTLGAGQDDLTVNGTHTGMTSISTQAGDDFLTINGVGGETTIHTGSGSDEIQANLSSGLELPAEIERTSNNYEPFVGLLSIDGGGTEGEVDTLEVTSTHGEQDSGLLTGTLLIGFGMGEGISYVGLEQLELDLSDAVNNLTIANTHLGNTNLNTNAGDDLVTLEANGGPTTITTGAGEDSVFVKTIDATTLVYLGDDDDWLEVGDMSLSADGDNAAMGIVNGIQAILEVHGQGASDVLRIDDSADQLGNSGQLTANFIGGLGTSEGITYTGFEDLTIALGSGNDKFDILATHYESTFVHAAAGIDELNIQAVSGPTVVDAGEQDDVFNVGSLSPTIGGGTLNNLAASLMLDGGDGNDTLNADDTGESQADAGFLSENTIGGFGSQGINYADLEGLELSLGSGGNSVEITGSMRRDDFRTLSIINTGAGSDTVSALVDGESHGPLAVNLESGDDLLDATGSTLGLFIFGGLGKDSIFAGAMNDVVFGDRGLIEYFAADNMLTTRLGLGLSERNSDPASPLFVPPKLTDGGNGGFSSAVRDSDQGGDDLVIGSSGDDLIFGGPGMDFLLGGSASSDGPDGSDIIHGGSGKDAILGDNGFYVLDVAGTLVEFGSSDPLLGGDDVLFGEGDEDIVFGGHGSDEIHGGDAHDVLLGDHGKWVWDTTADTLPTIESIFISAGDGGGDDVVYGDAGDDFLIGQQGEDQLFGGSGQDDLTGGHNVPFGADGGDLLDGGDDADVLLGDNGQILRTPLAWEEYAWATYPEPFPDVIRELVTFDELDGAGGDDDLSGGAGMDLLYAQIGNDIADGNEDDDEIVGGAGNDELMGGSGNDVLLGDRGQILRAYDQAGSPRLTPAGGWQREIVLEHSATVTAIIDMDTTPLRSDFSLASALQNADLLLLTAAFDSAGNRYQNTDNSAWDTDILLLDIAESGDDRLAGGDGDDIIVGQHGDDELYGDANKDLLIGDQASVYAPFDSIIPQIVEAIRIIHVAADLPLLTESGGSLVVPDIAIQPAQLSLLKPLVRDYRALSSQLQAIARNAGIARDDGTKVVPFASVLPELMHSLDVLPGNDRLYGGAGQDELFGDNLRILSEPNGMQKQIDDALNDVYDQLGNLQERLFEFGLDYELADLGLNSQSRTNATQFGNDVIDGGDDDDYLVGDDGIVIVPGSTVETLDPSNYEAEAVERYTYWRDLEHVFTDFDFILQDAHHRVLQSLVDDALERNPQRKKIGTADILLLDHAGFILQMDELVGGSGDDTLVGDHGLVVTPVVSTQATRQNQQNSRQVDSQVEKQTDSKLKALDNLRDQELKDHIRDNHADPAASRPANKDLKLIPWELRFDKLMSDDELAGGDGDDLLIGDRGEFVMPVVLDSPLKQNAALEVSRSLFDLLDEPGFAAWLERSVRSEQVQRQYYDEQDASATDVRRLGRADRLLGEGGDDVILGDNARVVPQADASVPSAEWIHYAHPLDGAGESDAGNDGGDDLIEGGDGADMAFGQSGDDIMLGGAQNDLLFGGRGNDAIEGEDGDDTLYGGSGQDDLDGGNGQNSVNNGGSDGGDQAIPIRLSRPWLQDLLFAELAESEVIDPNCELWLAFGGDEEAGDA
ncbi:MAG: dockerin type I domain-containing protein [bacterium]|nr:dockerin type I domain-containing protein [bacterium]